jgi:hypothetical protein
MLSYPATAGRARTVFSTVVNIDSSGRASLADEQESL